MELLCFQYMENTKVHPIAPIQNVENTKVPPTSQIQNVENTKVMRLKLGKG